MIQIKKQSKNHKIWFVIKYQNHTVKLLWVFYGNGGISWGGPFSTKSHDTYHNDGYLHKADVVPEGYSGPSEDLKGRNLEGEYRQPLNAIKNEEDLGHQSINIKAAIPFISRKKIARTDEVIIIDPKHLKGDVLQFRMFLLEPSEGALKNLCTRPDTKDLPTYVAKSASPWFVVMIAP